MIGRIVVVLSMFAGLLAVGGCDGAPDALETVDKSANSSAGSAVEQARTGLLARDLAFGNAVAEYGLAEAYRMFLATDAVQLPDGDWPLSGRDAIYEQILEATQGSDFALSWKPEAAEVSVAGDLGYTWGTYWLEMLDEDGEPVVVQGNYVNVWRRPVDGVWEVVLDISNQINIDYVASAKIEDQDAAADPDIE